MNSGSRYFYLLLVCAHSSCSYLSHVTHVAHSSLLLLLFSVHSVYVLNGIFLSLRKNAVIMSRRSGGNSWSGSFVSRSLCNIASKAFFMVIRRRVVLFFDILALHKYFTDDACVFAILLPQLVCSCCESSGY